MYNCFWNRYSANIERKSTIFPIKYLPLQIADKDVVKADFLHKLSGFLCELLKRLDR